MAIEAVKKIKDARQLSVMTPTDRFQEVCQLQQTISGMVAEREQVKHRCASLTKEIRIMEERRDAILNAGVDGQITFGYTDEDDDSVEEAA